VVRLTEAGRAADDRPPERKIRYPGIDPRWCESGTGKELVAAAIQIAGCWPSAFRGRGCGSLVPTELIESECLAMKKARFRAIRVNGRACFKRQHAGLFSWTRSANSPGITAKLLRVLQEEKKEVRP